RIDHQLGDERPTQCSRQRVTALIQCAGHQRRKNKAIDKEIAGIDRNSIDGSGFESLLLDRFDIFALAQVGGEGDDVVAVFVLDPRHHDRGIEAAGVRKNDFVWHGTSLFMVTRSLWSILLSLNGIGFQRVNDVGGYWVRARPNRLL